MPCRPLSPRSPSATKVLIGVPPFAGVIVISTPSFPSCCVRVAVTVGLAPSAPLSPLSPLSPFGITMVLLSVNVTNLSPFACGVIDLIPIDVPS